MKKFLIIIFMMCAVAVFAQESFPVFSWGTSVATVIEAFGEPDFRESDAGIVGFQYRQATYTSAYFFRDDKLFSYMAMGGSSLYSWFNAEVYMVYGMYTTKKGATAMWILDDTVISVSLRNGQSMMVFADRSTL